MESDLAAALADMGAVWGTTARTGGWRKGLLTPAQAAPEICSALAEFGPANEVVDTDATGGAKGVAVVFGPEDRGLTNDEIEHCGRLITIPTVPEASSLNLAHAVLVLLYECFTRMFGQDFRPGGPAVSRPASHAERETLYTTLRRTLERIDFLKPDDPTDYWMLPVRRLVERVTLRRNEYSLLMGICRQVEWAVEQGGSEPAGTPALEKAAQRKEKSGEGGGDE